MMNTGIDPEALAKLFSDTSAQQGEALQQAVSDATLRALQGRELTVENIRKALKSVTQAVSQASAVGSAAAPAVDVEALLGQAFDGMDAALRQAVEAQRQALEAMVGQGVGLKEKQMQAALAGVEKMEDLFFTTVTKAVKGAGGPLQAPWEHVLDAMKAKGTATGTQAASAVKQVMSQAQTSLRESRASGIRAAQAMMDSYAALAGGVLIGMSQALAQGTGGSAASTRATPESASTRSRRT